MSSEGEALTRPGWSSTLSELDSPWGFGGGGGGGEGGDEGRESSRSSFCVVPNSHLIDFLIPLTCDDEGATLASLALSLVAGWETGVPDSDRTNGLRLPSRDDVRSFGLTPIENVANCSVACSAAASVGCSPPGSEALEPVGDSARLMVPNITFLDGLDCQPFVPCAACFEAPGSVVIAGDVDASSVVCGTACSEALI